jgi:transcriptional regulator GlxA family with amidase domain
MKLIVVGVVIASVTSGMSSAVAAQTVAASGTVRSNAGGSIAGHVTNAHAQPIDSYLVIVFPTDRKVWSADSQLVKFARPAQDGGFEVVGLPPGEYWVVAVDAIQGDQGARDSAKPEVLRVLSSRATRVILADHERYMTVLRLIRR